MNSRDKWRLQSGKIVNTYFGVVGLSPDLDLTGGFDDMLERREDATRFREGMLPDFRPEEFFTPAERLEIAEEMIRRWQKYGDLVASGEYDKRSERMSSIYIVVSGDYSDYRIKAVFDDIELAKSYCRKRNADGNDGVPVHKYDDENHPYRLTSIVTADYYIEIHDVNPENPE